MVKYINTSKGKLEYNPVHFEIGKKIIDVKISTDNLLTFRKVMLRENLFFGLIYGTLLGAVRENNFIRHDEDTDVFILNKDREKFINMLWKLNDYGFTVGRYDGDLLSIIKNDEYIDIYIFNDYNSLYKNCDENIIKIEYLTNTIEYFFLGEFFNIPKNYENCLIELYGSDWKTPIKGFHAANYKLSVKIKMKLNELFPVLYKIGKFLLNVK